MTPILDAFGKQVAWCASLGSPFTATLLSLVRDDIAAAGPFAALLAAWPGDPLADALALRVAGAFHALVLSGRAPRLAAAYPPSPPPAAAALRGLLLDALATHHAPIAAFLASPPQTNEVGRSGVLAGGFLHIAAATGLPLGLLEIGASAGLNTVWDRMRFQFGAEAWGDVDSPVVLAPTWSGAPPPTRAPVQVRRRRACDVAPVDLHDPAQRLRLMAYVWPDQPQRLARLRAAIGLAQAAGVTVDRADAGPWVARHLRPEPGVATVLYHTIMWQYMPAETQAAVTAALHAAAASATAAAPLAWLRFEPTRPETRPELRLTLWPPGTETLLAAAHPHGAEVQWHPPQA